MQFVNSVLLLGCFVGIFWLTMSEIIFEDCGSVVGNYTSLNLTGCDPRTMEYCPLKKGKNVTMDLGFLTKEDVTKVTVKVYGYIAGVPIPFILSNPDGCLNSGLTCPIANNTENVYTLTLPIRMLYPKLQVDVRLELQDQSGTEIVCVLIPAKIV